MTGYNKLKNGVRCGCWAHVRRKFVDALPGDKELRATLPAAKDVEYCNRLFLLERKYNGEDEKGNKVADPLTTDQSYCERQVQSKAVLDEFFALVEGISVSKVT